MGKMCDECFETYSSDKMSPFPEMEEGKAIYACPKRGCWGEIQEVDDVILPTIVELNKKGYYTESCCSGHLEDTIGALCYIRFLPGVYIDESKIPEGFSLSYLEDEETDLKSIILERMIPLMDQETSFARILAIGLDLFVWAKSLKASRVVGPEDILAFITGVNDFLNDPGATEPKESGFDVERLKKDTGKIEGTFTMKEIAQMNKGESKVK